MKAGERTVGIDVQPVETKPQRRARTAARQVIDCDEWPGSFMLFEMLASVSSRMSPNTVSAGRRYGRRGGLEDWDILLRLVRCLRS